MTTAATPTADGDGDGDDDARATLGHAVFRVLCAETRVGGLIGKSGANVKRIVGETGAAVKVLESPTQGLERAVLVSAPRGREARKEACAAKTAAMMVVKFLTSNARRGGEGSDDETEDAERSDGDEGGCENASGDGDGGESTELGEEGGEKRLNDGETTGAPRRTHVALRLLVPAGQAGHLIGKGGENIRKIRLLANGAHVAVQEVGQVPPCATSEDRVVEIHGPRKDVRAAAELVFDLLRDFLVDSSVLGYYQPTVAAPRDMRSEYAANAAAAMAFADPAIVGITPAMMAAPPMPPMYMMPAVPPSAVPPPMIHETVEVEGEAVSNVLGDHGNNISTIAQISGCQVSLIETDPETNTSAVELKGPHESNIAAAKSLVRAFAAGEMPAAGVPNGAVPAMHPMFAAGVYAPMYPPN
jgi:transcription antitermination factor NusA-like protein